MGWITGIKCHISHFVFLFHLLSLSLWHGCATLLLIVSKLKSYSILKYNVYFRMFWCGIASFFVCFVFIQYTYALINDNILDSLDSHAYISLPIKSDNFDPCTEYVTLYNVIEHFCCVLYLQNIILDPIFEYRVSVLWFWWVLLWVWPFLSGPICCNVITNANPQITHCKSDIFQLFMLCACWDD